MLIDTAGTLECLLYRPLRDFIKGYAPNALVTVLILFLLFPLGAVAEFLGQVRCNRLAFAVRVRREIDGIDAASELLQLGDNLLFTGDDDVLGLEVVVDIDTESA